MMMQVQLTKSIEEKEIVNNKMNKAQIYECLKKHNIMIDAIKNVDETALSDPYSLSLYISSRKYIDHNNHDRVKRKDIYHAAVKAWYEETKNKVKDDLTFSLDEFIKFVCYISIQMYCHDNTQAIAVNIVAKDMKDNDMMISNILNSLHEKHQITCPLQINNASYSFIDKTFRDYFCGLAFTKYMNQYIEKKLVTEDIDIQQWCGEFVKVKIAMNHKIGSLKKHKINKATFSIKALERINASRFQKKSRCIAIGAANCMTILNTGGFSFSGRDFSETQLGEVDDSIEYNLYPFMDLTGAVLHKCNFCGANLAGALLQQCLLDGTNFSACNLRNVVFGELPSFIGHNDIVNTVAVSPDGIHLFSGSNDAIIKQWSIKNRECIRTLNEHSDTISALTVSSDGQYLFSASKDQSIIQWIISTGEIVHRFNGHTELVQEITLSHDNKFLFSVSSDKTVNQWDITTGKLLYSFNQLSQYAGDLAITPDCKYLFAVSESNETINQFDIDTKECIRTLKGHTSFIYSLVVSPNGQYLFSGSWDSTIVQWSVATGELIRKFEGHYDRVISLIVSPDNEYVYSAAEDNTIKKWSISKGNLIHTFYEVACKISISTNGQYLFFRALDGSIKQVSTIRRRIKENNGHVHQIRKLLISPNNRYLFSGSYDRTIKQWSIATGKLIRTFSGHSEVIYGLSVSRDGKYLYTAAAPSNFSEWGTFEYKKWSIDKCECICDIFKDEFYAACKANTRRLIVTNNPLQGCRAVEKNVYRLNKKDGLILWSSAPFDLSLSEIKFDNAINMSQSVEQLLMQRSQVESKFKLVDEDVNNNSRRSKNTNSDTLWIR